MNIRLAIIDHSHADIDAREKFSFTENAVRDGVKFVVENSTAKGCVIISTCNRTEIYVSARQHEVCPSPFSLICKLKNLDKEKYRKYFVELSGIEVSKHLFYLSAGMKSRIFGEDQIITQVKDSVQISRECETLDTKLELLFKSAVTCAKKIKTKVKLTTTESSLGESALKLIRKTFPDKNDIRALIIGNGEMGRLVARTLVADEIRTDMTIRRYKHGDVLIPAGCGVAEYDKRFEVLPLCDVVISATRSPHYTVSKSDIEGKLTKKTLFLDLAMPRDIEKNIDDEMNAQLFDIDDFETEGSDEAILTASEIIADDISQMMNTYKFKKVIPILNNITEKTSKYVTERVSTKTIDEELILYIEKITKRAVSKLIYGVRDNMDYSEWKQCMEAMEKGAEN